VNEKATSPVPVIAPPAEVTIAGSGCQSQLMRSLFL
jgi:hypothetical protein